MVYYFLEGGAFMWPILLTLLFGLAFVWCAIEQHSNDKEQRKWDKRFREYDKRWKK